MKVRDLVQALAVQPLDSEAVFLQIVVDGENSYIGYTPVRHVSAVDAREENGKIRALDADEDKDGSFKIIIVS